MIRRRRSWIAVVLLAQAGSLALVHSAEAQEAALALIEGIPIPQVGERSEPAEKASLEVLATIQTGTSGVERARLLESLRDRVFDALPWTASALLEIAASAVSARRGCWDENPAALIEDLQRLGFAHLYRSELDDARSQFEESIRVARASFGDSSDELAGALINMSSLLAGLGNYSEALETADRSLAIRRAQSSPQIGKIVLSINARASVLYTTEKFDDAISAWKEAYDLTKQLPPAADRRSLMPRIANNLGESYFRVGALKDALRYLEQARKLYETGGPGGTPARQLPSTLLNLADLYYAVGDYPAAIEAYEKALQGHRIWVGDDSIRLANNLSSLALVLEESGLWEQARARLLQALALRRSFIPPDAGGRPNQVGSPHYLNLLIARDLARLGALQHRLGEPTARDLLEEALAIQQKELSGQPNSDLATTLVDLARLELDDTGPGAAAPYIRQAIELLGTLDGSQPLLVEAYRLAALIEPDDARGLDDGQQGLRLAREIYGPESPRTADLLFTVASLRTRSGFDREAVTDALAAYSLSTDHMRRVIQAFPEEQALAFAADRRRNLDLALSLLVRDGKDLGGQAISGIWEAIAGSRSLVFDAQIARQRLARASLDPGIAELAKRLAAARNRLAYLLVQSYRDPTLQQAEVHRANEEVTAAEGELARRSARELVGEPEVAVRLAEVRRALPAGGALVSFARYRDTTDEVEKYLALVVERSSTTPAPVSLGPARVVDDAVVEWRRRIFDDLAGEDPPGAAPSEVRSRAAGAVLRRLVWDPVVRHLARPGVVFLVPDGSLNLVNFSSFPSGGHRYLIDDGWVFHNVMAERALLARPGKVPAGRGLLLVGGVDYRQVEVAVSASPSTLTRGASGPPGAEQCQRRLPYFQELPASVDEVERIAELWRRSGLEKGGAKPVLLEKSLASEGRVRELVKGSRIVHLATHGFITSDTCARPRSGYRGIGGLSIQYLKTDEPSLALVGLALAGANRRDLREEGSDDGLLLAEEVANLDLEGVEWVVLSACETGLGTVEPGEGVRSLARAFQLGGARTLILSLWAVEDLAARVWMEHLYEARLVRGETTAQAINPSVANRCVDLRVQAACWS